MAEKKTKIDIFSGFLGAGKTTLIKKLIKEAFAGEQIVLIENEFGEIGIDGGFMREAGIQVNELNSGCICCSLVGDFREALKKVVETYHPDRILIEPSGVGKLSDVTRAVEGVAEDLPVILNSFVTVADVNKVKMYMKNFGEFYDDQISHASCIILSRTGNASEEKVAAAVALLAEKNPTATIVTTDWTVLTGAQIVSVMDGKRDLVAELLTEARAANVAHADEDEHEHHHHHHHHHGHDADEVFVSWGEETHKKFTKAEIEGCLKALEDAEKYGMVLRCKGYVANAEGGKWIHFDYVPGEPDIREGGAMVTGRICVIGSKLNEQAVAELFGTAH